MATETHLFLIPTALEAQLLLGDTHPDRAARLRQQPVIQCSETALVGLCGFGLAAAGAGAARCLDEARLLTGKLPDTAFLLGFGGTFEPDRAPLGALVRGAVALLFGIGAGEGAEHLAGHAIGFSSCLPWIAPQLHGEGQQGAGQQGEGQQGDAYPLAAHSRCAALPVVPLLSVTSSSASLAQAAERRASAPAGLVEKAGLVEEMESFAVAAAAAAWGVPLCVVRAISNVAGERRREQWRIKEAGAELRSWLAPQLKEA